MTVAATSSGRVTPQWALVVSAFLFGICVAGALFVGVWRHEAGRAKAADRALAYAQVDAEASTRALDGAKVELERVQGETRRQAEILARLPTAGKPVLVEAGRLEASARRLAADGADLRRSMSRLTSAVANLSGYLNETSAAELDPAYVAAQLSYLEEALATLRGRSDSLAQEAGSLAATRQGLTKKTAALRRLVEAAEG